jgi:cytochrome c-type biogenesis protein CcmF
VIVECGHFALILALAVALVQTALPIWGARRGDERLMAMAVPAAQTQFLLVAYAFGALMWAYVVSDFSVANVYMNSHSAKPLLYKISGVWGNHEGSMVLWVLILALFGSAVAFFGRNLPLPLKANVLGVQASIALAFLLFIVTTSDPFTRLDPAPFEGKGLNPILQDPALAFHPPLLYAGYVGFSMAYSFAMAALLEGRVDAAWARWVRPWTLAAWICLTLGIALGSWWAYYELGWGGWWFWDPVENASLMPWLAGTALLHSAIVLEKRDSLKVWTILLAILAFALSLVGTFLVRSGVLTSVHAFAVDPERGTFILGILALFIGGSFSLYAWRAPILKPGGYFAPVSREGSIILNNLLLMAACGLVFTGTLYPLALEALTGLKISVGAPFFNITFGPVMVLLTLALPFGPLLPWKRGDLLGVSQRLMAAGGLALAAMVTVMVLGERAPWLAAFGVGLGLWVIAGTLTEIGSRARVFEVSMGESWQRLASLPRAAWGTTLAHIGLGVLILGIVGVSAWRVERILAVKIGESFDIAGYTLRLDSVTQQPGPNYDALVASFSLSRQGKPITVLESSKRAYTAPRMQTSKVGIYPAWMGDVYVVAGDENNGAYAIRAYFNPLVRLLWIGALLMSLGGLLSLSDRKLRLGAPKQAAGAAALRGAQ